MPFRSGEPDGQLSRRALPHENVSDHVRFGDDVPRRTVTERGALLASSTECVSTAPPAMAIARPGIAAARARERPGILRAAEVDPTWT